MAPARTQVGSLSDPSRQGTSSPWHSQGLIGVPPLTSTTLLIYSVIILFKSPKSEYFNSIKTL